MTGSEKKTSSPALVTSTPEGLSFPLFLLSSASFRPSCRLASNSRHHSLRREDRDGFDSEVVVAAGYFSAIEEELEKAVDTLDIVVVEGLRETFGLGTLW